MAFQTFGKKAIKSNEEINTCKKHLIYSSTELLMIFKISGFKISKSENFVTRTLTIFFC